MLPNTKKNKSNEDPEMPNTNIQDKINKSTGVEKSTEQTVQKEFYVLQEAAEVKDEDGRLVQLPARTKIRLL